MGLAAGEGEVWLGGVLGVDDVHVVYVVASPVVMRLKWKLLAHGCLAHEIVSFCGYW